MKDYSGQSATKEGTVTHEGKPVIVDLTAPAVTVEIKSSGSNIRKTVVVAVTDNSPPAEISYKIHSSSCGNKSAYDGVQGVEKKAKLMDGKAHIPLIGTQYNSKYVCIKVVDTVTKETYTSSSQLSGFVRASVIFSEIFYSGGGGVDYEWVEVTNMGSTTVSLIDYHILDGETERTITHHKGTPETISAGATGIIAKNPDKFKESYSGYTGPLFKAPFSLKDTGDVLKLILTSEGTEVDGVMYVRADGAHKNDKSLHITDTGVIFEGTPTPGVRTAGQPIISDGAGRGGASRTQTTTLPDDTLATVYSFDGSAGNVIAGQNLFFTTKDSVGIVFTLQDKETTYSSSNISQYLTDEHSATRTNKYQVTRERVTDVSEGVRVTYTVYFSPSNNTLADNRVTFLPKLTDGSSNTNTARAAIVVVRDTTTPTLAKSTNATVLGFSSTNNVIVPVTASDIASGDWLRLTHGGSCADNGLSSYVAKNGGYGAYYDLDDGTYNDCTLTG